MQPVTMKRQMSVFESPARCTQFLCTQYFEGTFDIQIMQSKFKLLFTNLKHELLFEGIYAPIFV